MAIRLGIGIFAVCAFIAISVDATAQRAVEKYCPAKWDESAHQGAKVFAPQRETIFYIDSGKMEFSSPNDLKKANWYTQFEKGLRSNMLPSEKLAIVLMKSERGETEDLWAGCWPGYTTQQLKEQKEANTGGFMKYMFGKDINKLLQDDLDIFLNWMRKSMLKTENESPGNSTGNYVRALAGDEARFRGEKAVRVIVYGGMGEESDIASVAGGDKSAREAAKRFKLKLNGASFYVYGVEPGAEREAAEEFWDAFIHEKGGYLAHFAPGLQLPEKPPVVFERIEVEIKSTRGPRPGVITVAADDSGKLQDSFIEIAGLLRSKLTGKFSYDDNSKCAGNYALEALTDRSIHFTGNGDEKIVLKGRGSQLTGTISDIRARTRRGRKAEARITARLASCESN